VDLTQLPASGDFGPSKSLGKLMKGIHPVAAALWTK
jgi:hypothetical protein